MAGIKKKIMIAMDGSKHSDYAFEWYMTHLRDTHDYLFLVHCAELEVINYRAFLTKNLVELNAVIAEQDNMARLIIARLKEHLKRRHVNGEVIRRNGNPKHQLLKVAENNDIDCIIVGCCSKRPEIGSVSSYLLHHTKTPFVVVRRQKPNVHDDEFQSCDLTCTDHEKKRH